MGGKALAVVNTGGLNLREVAARATLRDVRSKGHVYVELRQVGKRTIFFCTLCQTQCFNDTVLNDHLNGNLHSRRYAAAEVTLLGSNPWPFSDGVLFFDTSLENGVSGVNNGVLVVVDGNSNKAASGSRALVCIKGQGNGKVLKQNRNSGPLVVPGVLLKEQVRNLRVRLIGHGHIGARLLESSEGCRGIVRMWCAWLGQDTSDDCKELLKTLKCEFAVVTFSYMYDLGRKANAEELEDSLSLESFFEIDDLGHPRKKKKKSFSDPEDSPDRLSGCSEDSSCQLHDSRLVPSIHDSRLIPSRSVRKELRKHKRLTAERTCDICGQAMLPGKDVSTLLNLKTGKLACSSRNVNGAFHLFHTSCLTHWILLCESEIWSSQLANVKTTTCGRKSKLRQKNRISIFCPECQGTGMHIEGDELERPTVPLSEMFLCKLKVIQAHKTWMNDPEVLNRCSTGLHFSSDLEKVGVQETVMHLKLLRFYRAGE